MKSLFPFLCVQCPSGNLHWRWERLCTCGPQPYDLRAKRVYHRESEEDNFRLVRQALLGRPEAILRLPRRTRRRLGRQMWPMFKVAR